MDVISLREILFFPTWREELPFSRQTPLTVPTLRVVTETELPFPSTAETWKI
jgi:hypothetical protein